MGGVICGLCENLAIDRVSQRRAREAGKSTILAPSDPALSFWFWSILLDLALSGGILVEVGELWVAEDGRKGQWNGFDVD